MVAKHHGKDCYRYVQKKNRLNEYMERNGRKRTNDAGDEPRGPRGKRDEEVEEEHYDKEHQRTKDMYKRRNEKIDEREKWNSTKKNVTVEALSREYQELPERAPESFKTFNDFPLSAETRRGLDECEFVEPTDIQRNSLLFTLTGSDLVGAAKTGSGKTLSFVIPILEGLWRKQWASDYGTGAIIICPSRELALQTYNCLTQVGKYHDFSVCLLIGRGNKFEFEEKRMRTMNIIVCTPGRLLQHLEQSVNVYVDDLQMLVIDEADLILEHGFKEQLDNIMSFVPKERQTMLFSATQTKNVEDLVRVVSNDPVFVSVDEKAEHVTPDQLTQLYTICEDYEKINLLWSFIVSHRRAKILVFTNTCKMAEFLFNAFSRCIPGISVYGITGDMPQWRRFQAVEKYESQKHAVLIATDIASRGLDFPWIDWVVQFDCPNGVSNYIHRVGRSARMGRKGQGVLFLEPHQEAPMVKCLGEKKIPIQKMQVDSKSLKDIRNKLQSTLILFPELKTLAQKAFVCHMRGIYSCSNKAVFDVSKIHAKEVAEHMGLLLVPRVRFLAKRGMNVAARELQPMFADTEDILSVKRKDVFNITGAGNAEEKQPWEEVEKTKVRRSVKIVTKEQAAMKILHKNIRVNTKRTFSDSEEEIEEEKDDAEKVELNSDEEAEERWRQRQKERDAVPIFQQKRNHAKTPAEAKEHAEQEYQALQDFYHGERDKLPPLEPPLGLDIDEAKQQIQKNKWKAMHELHSIIRAIKFARKVKTTGVQAMKKGEGFDEENPFRLQDDSKMVDLGKDKQYADADDVEEMAEAPDLSWLPQVASEDEDDKLPTNFEDYEDQIGGEAERFPWKKKGLSEEERFPWKKKQTARGQEKEGAEAGRSSGSEGQDHNDSDNYGRVDDDSDNDDGFDEHIRRRMAYGNADDESDEGENNEGDSDDDSDGELDESQYPELAYSDEDDEEQAPAPPPAKKKKKAGVRLLSSVEDAEREALAILNPFK